MHFPGVLADVMQTLFVFPRAEISFINQFEIALLQHELVRFGVSDIPSDQTG
jgi:hypothetical protein